MTENKIKFDRLDSYLASIKMQDIPGLILISGDSYLVKHALKGISSFFITNADNNKFALETLEGDCVTMGQIIEQVSTFSFFVLKKIIIVKNPPLFQSAKGGGFTSSEIEIFIDFVQKGFPENHFLVLTSQHMDKRTKQYKAIADKALIIDCSVATGTRQADLNEQKNVLLNIADKILSKSGKVMDNRALLALIDLTGFNIELFSQNLEKLISFSGRSRTISSMDVKKLIVRDKKDPLFSLTNAFMAKDVKNAVNCLNSLFNQGFHPLQIFRLFENQIRKLILVKSFNEEFCQSNPHVNLKHISFNMFRQSVLPKMIARDKKTKKNMDFSLVPNPKSAYPVYQTVQKSENFSLKELTMALVFLGDLDYRLKSSSLDAKTALENFIILTCRKGGFVYAEKN